MIIAVDFDGTIVTHDYPRIGKEIPFAIDSLKRLQEKPDFQLILWTVREGDLLEEAVQYCRERGLEFYAVNCNYPEESDENPEPRKLQADLFIDDRNLGGLPDWGIIYRMIVSGKHYEPISNEIEPEYTLPKRKSIFAAIFGK
jgi:hydroxymethylpyrimidine pyrophosphatase-like HAD family hydrolase